MAFFWLKLDDPTSEYARSLSLEDKMRHLLDLMESSGVQPPIKRADSIFSSDKNEWTPEDL